ncbi:Oidioi.mRNA.OKI2018_I69.chr1.g512.t1.cds [Oikopleura dioica]|uniref:Carbohydrate sulfotransferase n=1 Tax=Oikopleura dioica TaxID=34765 RepID=A0ABN7SQA1_OIKDI|nr:Oidioi.mRNA.OKI2018_I69.chr1.g512.t1.cds [Oikopleura dioica]
MDRIFSGWKDKMNRTEDREMYYEYPGKEIIREEFNLPKDFEFPKRKMDAHQMGYYVSFQMFARWLAKNDHYKTNIHWNTVQSSCDICAFDFDFIGLISQMDQDMPRLMEKLKVQSPTYDEIQQGFQSANAHSTKHSKLRIDEEFGKLTDIERAKLVEIYIEDYAAFGLPIPDFAK